MYSLNDEISDTSIERPHVIILGAGASIEAVNRTAPKIGEMPSMDNFVEIVGLKDLLKRNNIQYEGKNIENIYSDLYEITSHEKIINEINSAIYNYFIRFNLPNYPTLYDVLVLSLRKKDFIATFNWDPFLIQAYERNNKYKQYLPEWLLLHGSVLLKSCNNCKKIFPNAQEICPNCRGTLDRPKMIYPIKDKNYSDDINIKNYWDGIKYALKNAYYLTIFGYSKPSTDVKAIEILKEAWKQLERLDSKNRFIEIIDTDDESKIRKSWQEFFPCRDSYRIIKKYEDSWIAKHPRRTAEAYWQQSQEIQFLNDNPIPKYDNISQLWEWLEPFFAAENKNRSIKRET